MYLLYLLMSTGNLPDESSSYSITWHEEWYLGTSHQYIRLIVYYTNLIFEYCKSLGNQSNVPFNLILEESHRYIQDDNDTYLFGYNIFDRIAKEGRKYGVIMGLLSQRPMELSETVISQISNFFIFKMTHPQDVEYIKKMLPNISEDVVEKQKVLQAGTCIAFGKAFRIPLLLHFSMPNPAPFSSNFNMVDAWKM